MADYIGRNLLYLFNIYKVNFYSKVFGMFNIKIMKVNYIHMIFHAILPFWVLQVVVVHVSMFTFQGGF